MQRKYSRLSKNKIKVAIKDSGGIIAIICKRTGYSWGAVRDFIRKDDELIAMMKDEAETIDDMAEATIITKIKDGDEGSAKWWLARRRRTEFGDNIDLTSKNEKIQTIVKVGIDPDKI